VKGVDVSVDKDNPASTCGKRGANQAAIHDYQISTGFGFQGMINQILISLPNCTYGGGGGE
jgi:hypothetical protein